MRTRRLPLSFCWQLVGPCLTGKETWFCTWLCFAKKRRECTWKLCHGFAFEKFSKKNLHGWSWHMLSSHAPPRCSLPGLSKKNMPSGVAMAQEWQFSHGLLEKKLCTQRVGVHPSPAGCSFPPTERFFKKNMHSWSLVAGMWLCPPGPMSGGFPTETGF